MKNTYIIIVMALLLSSCGNSSKKATPEESVSEEALMEQMAEEENLSEFERYVIDAAHVKTTTMTNERKLYTLFICYVIL